MPKERQRSRRWKGSDGAVSFPHAADPEALRPWCHSSPYRYTSARHTQRSHPHQIGGLLDGKVLVLLLDGEATRGEGRRRGRTGGRIGAGKGRVQVGGGRVSVPTGGGGGSGGWVARVGRRRTLGPPPCGSTTRGTRRSDWRRRRKWRMGHPSSESGGHHQVAAALGARLTGP
jgi:hypothetical protein